MQQASEEGAGIYRNHDGLSAAGDTLRALHERMDHIRLDDRSLTFNTEIVAALELANMLDVADTVIYSALARTESRGAHQGTDFADRDDERFLAHSLAYHVDDDAPRIELSPVTITRWPPAERVYGQ